MVFAAVVGLVLAPSAAMADWWDYFDTYTPGSINGQGGWQGWDNVPAAAGTVVTTPWLSAPHSQEINAPTDSVHQYSGYTTGLWTYTAWQYIPASYSGQTYFILLNQYNDGGPYNWSIQVRFDSTTDRAQSILYSGAVDGNQIPLVRGAWAEIRDVIDLTADTQSFYYNNQLVVTKSWTNGVADPAGPGILNLAAVDLYGNLASSVWYDNMSLTPEPASLALLGLGLLLVTRRR
jgi:hypothetical protein